MNQETLFALADLPNILDRYLPEHLARSCGYCGAKAGEVCLSGTTGKPVLAHYAYRR